jgi:hypothetical protein
MKKVEESENYDQPGQENEEQQFPMTYQFVALKKDNAATLVARGEVISCSIELDSGDDIRYEIAPRSEYVKACGVYQNSTLMNENIPSVMSSTSPLSPKHCAKRQPPDPEGSSMR